MTCVRNEGRALGRSLRPERRDLSDERASAPTTPTVNAVDGQDRPYNDAHPRFVYRIRTEGARPSSTLKLANENPNGLAMKHAKVRGLKSCAKARERVRNTHREPQN